MTNQENKPSCAEKKKCDCQIHANPQTMKSIKTSYTLVVCLLSILVSTTFIISVFSPFELSDTVTEMFRTSIGILFFWSALFFLKGVYLLLPLTRLFFMANLCELKNFSYRFTSCILSTFLLVIFGIIFIEMLKFFRPFCEGDGVALCDLFFLLIINLAIFSPLIIIKVDNVIFPKLSNFFITRDGKHVE